MNIELLLKYRDEAVSKGLPVEEQERYIKWKQKFMELDYPMPDLQTEEEMEHLFEMVKGMMEFETTLSQEDEDETDVEENTTQEE